MANKKKKEEKKDNKHTIKVCANIRNQYDFYMTGGQESITDTAIPKSNKIQKQLKKAYKAQFPNMANGEIFRSCHKLYVNSDDTGNPLKKDIVLEPDMDLVTGVHDLLGVFALTDEKIFKEMLQEDLFTYSLLKSFFGICTTCGDRQLCSTRDLLVVIYERIFLEKPHTPEEVDNILSGLTRKILIKKIPVTFGRLNEAPLRGKFANMLKENFYRCCEYIIATIDSVSAEHSEPRDGTVNPNWFVFTRKRIYRPVDAEEFAELFCDAEQSSAPKLRAICKHTGMLYGMFPSGVGMIFPYIHKLRDEDREYLLSMTKCLAPDNNLTYSLNVKHPLREMSDFVGPSVELPYTPIRHCQCGILSADYLRGVRCPICGKGGTDAEGGMPERGIRVLSGDNTVCMAIGTTEIEKDTPSYLFQASPCLPTDGVWGTVYHRYITGGSSIFKSYMRTPVSLIDVNRDVGVSQVIIMLKNRPVLLNNLLSSGWLFYAKELLSDINDLRALLTKPLPRISSYIDAGNDINPTWDLKFSNDILHNAIETNISNLVTIARTELARRAQPRAFATVDAVKNLTNLIHYIEMKKLAIKLRPNGCKLYSKALNVVRYHHILIANDNWSHEPDPQTIPILGDDRHINTMNVLRDLLLGADPNTMATEYEMRSPYIFHEGYGDLSIDAVNTAIKMLSNISNDDSYWGDLNLFGQEWQ